MYNEEEDQNSDDKTCQNCGLRQYNNICANCGTPIETEEKEKTPDDDDEYDRRERR